jgi:hypothetical protein
MTSPKPGHKAHTTASRRAFYRDDTDAKRDRDQLDLLLAAIGGPLSTLRRDVTTAWILSGQFGYVSTWGDGATWMVVVFCRSPRHWSAVKAKLAGFCTVTQDGNGEGVFRLNISPNGEQAAVIRSAIGIRKRRNLNSPSLAKLNSAGVNSRFQAHRQPRNHPVATQAMVSTVQPKKSSKVAFSAALFIDCAAHVLRVTPRG